MGCTQSNEDFAGAKRRCPDRNGDGQSLIRPSFTNFSEKSALGPQIACWRHKLLEQYHKERPDQVLRSQLVKSAQGISNASFRARKRFRQYPGQWELSLKSKLGAESEAQIYKPSKEGICSATTKPETQENTGGIWEETSSAYRGKHEETETGDKLHNAKFDIFGRLKAIFSRNSPAIPKVRRETALRHKFLSTLASDYRGGPPQRSPFPEPNLRRIASGELWERSDSFSKPKMLDTAAQLENLKAVLWEVISGKFDDTRSDNSGQGKSSQDQPGPLTEKERRAIAAAQIGKRLQEVRSSYELEFKT